MDTNNNLQKDKYNYGIGLAKIFLTFVIVLCHFWNSGEASELSGLLYCFARAKSIAVLVFFMISFYFFENSINANSKYIKKRLLRLYIPLLCWGLIYYIAFLIISTKLPSILLGEINFQSLLWQITLGSSLSLCPPLWYLGDLIIITLFSTLLYRCLGKNKAFGILIAISILCIFIEYQGLNYHFFKDRAYQFKYSLGRIIEVFPCTCIGIGVSRIDFKKLQSAYRLIACAILIILVILLDRFNLNLPLKDSLGYAGAGLLLFAACFFAIMVILPLNQLPQLIRSILKNLADYSLGIYCIHWLIGTLFSYLMATTKHSIHRFTHCIIIWLICYLFALAFSKIPCKFCKMLVS